jgi:hypothetical protein
VRTLRLAGIAVAATLGLAACSVDQGAALFVGDERIPQSTVDDHVDRLADMQTEVEAELAGYDYTGDREMVIFLMLYTELGRALGLTAADTSGASDVTEALYLEGVGYASELQSQAEPRELNDAEIRALADAGFPIDQLTPDDQYYVMTMAGFADDLDGYVQQFDIRVNPRYGVDSIPLIDGVIEVAIPQR